MDISRGLYFLAIAGITMLPASIKAQSLKDNTKHKLEKKLIINHNEILTDYVFTILKKCNNNKEETIRLIKKHMIIEINKIRKEHGLGELIENEKLSKMSQNHAEDMIEKGYYLHINKEGESPSDRAEKMGIKIYYLRENIDKGSISIDQAVNEMRMNSAGHKRTILEPNIKDIGSGIVFGEFNDISEIYRIIVTGRVTD